MRRMAGLLIAMLSALLLLRGAGAAQSQARLQQVVEQAVPPVSWAAPASIGFGEALDGTELDASSPVSGSFVYTPAAGTILPEGQRTLSVLFQPSDANFKATTAQVGITVRPAAGGTFALGRTGAGEPVVWRPGNQLTIAVTPVGDFHQPIALRCVASAGYRCSLSKATMRPTTTALPLGVMIERESMRAPVAAGLVLLLLGWRRKKKGVAGMVLALGLLGCGVSDGGTGPTVTVTGQSLTETKTLVIQVVDLR